LNKKILLATMIAIIAVGVTSAYAVIDLKDDTTVTGNLAVTGVITGPTISALTTAISSAAICPAQNVVHWDKITFIGNIEIQNFANPIEQPEFISSTSLILYDIKVLDDPDKVADLNQKVIDKLNGLGYRILGQPANMLSPMDVVVFEVDYAIVCSTP